MSQRSRDNRYRAPGARADRPSSEMRRAERQALRRSEHQALHEALGGDLDEVMLPQHRRGGGSTDITPYPTDEPRRRFRVWKTKMWKRRSQQRLDRTQAEAALRAQK
jgi:hypothetical protein